MLMKKPTRLQPVSRKDLKAGIYFRVLVSGYASFSVSVLKVSGRPYVRWYHFPTVKMSHRSWMIKAVGCQHDFFKKSAVISRSLIDLGVDKTFNSLKVWSQPRLSYGAIPGIAHLIPFSSEVDSFLQGLAKQVYRVRKNLAQTELQSAYWIQILTQESWTATQWECYANNVALANQPLFKGFEEDS